MKNRSVKVLVFVTSHGPADKKAVSPKNGKPRPHRPHIFTTIQNW